MEGQATGARRGRAGGRQSVLPSGEDIEAMLATGMTQARIAEMCGTTSQAVSAKLQRHRKGTKTDAGWKRYWPENWFLQRSGGNGIRADHASTYVYKRLLEYTQRRQGVELDANATQKLDQFLDKLRSLDMKLYYDYTDPNGFRLRAARAGDDENVIWVAGP
ncbi:hypothetical protein [Umezawaea sp. NPDC059074]|uniref:hypothetical protein n=1 Tax=Umezawaea sp. NPDC059074 TaxID=3346716 RepID=UPI00368E775E